MKPRFLLLVVFSALWLLDVTFVGKTGLWGLTFPEMIALYLTGIAEILGVFYVVKRALK